MAVLKPRRGTYTSVYIFLGPLWRVAAGLLFLDFIMWSAACTAVLEIYIYREKSIFFCFQREPAR